MDPIFEIELGECPICRGAGVMQDEQGWSVSVSCMDCGAETADAEYRTPEERLESARRVALLWNMGKVIHNGMSDEKRNRERPAPSARVFLRRRNLIFALARDKDAGRPYDQGDNLWIPDNGLPA